MMTFLKRICVSFVVLLHLFLAFLVDFSFPHYASVQITGGDVKRMDKDGIIDAKNPADGPVRDVYFIYTKDAKNVEKVMAYRNEDTAWAFHFILNLTQPTSKPRLKALQIAIKTSLSNTTDIEFLC